MFSIFGYTYSIIKESLKILQVFQNHWSGAVGPNGKMSGTLRPSGKISGTLGPNEKMSGTLEHSLKKWPGKETGREAIKTTARSQREDHRCISVVDFAIDWTSDVGELICFSIHHIWMPKDKDASYYSLK